MAYAIPQEFGSKKVMVLSLSTKDLLMKPTICWRTWPSMTTGSGLVQGTTKVGKAMQILWSQFDTQLQDQFAALNEVFAQDIEMMRKIQEESFANAQWMAEESTHQVRKEIVFDDYYDLNDFNNQDLKGDSSCKNLSWEYEPMEEVQESLEVKEAYECYSFKLVNRITNIPVTDSCVPF